MEALEGEADKTSPEQEQMGSVCSPWPQPTSWACSEPLLHIFLPLSLTVNLKKVQTREGQRKHPPSWFRWTSDLLQGH